MNLINSSQGANLTFFHVIVLFSVFVVLSQKQGAEPQSGAQFFLLLLLISSFCIQPSVRAMMIIHIDL